MTGVKGELSAFSLQLPLPPFPIAGLLRAETGLLDHLEVVGRGLPYRGPAVPLVAVPTTAGTGLEAFAQGFWDALDGGDGEGARLGRSRLAYAALVSGITLAQVGLGAVHGLASPLGALHPVPHGAACGTLVAETTRVNLAALRARSPGSGALDRFARVGGLLGGTVDGAAAEPADRLVDTLREWTDRLELPRLSAFGITAADLDRIVANSRGGSMRTNPVALDDSELEEILRAWL